MIKPVKMDFPEQGFPASDPAVKVSAATGGCDRNVKVENVAVPFDIVTVCPDKIETGLETVTVVMLSDESNVPSLLII